MAMVVVEEEEEEELLPLAVILGEVAAAVVEVAVEALAGEPSFIPTDHR